MEFNNKVDNISSKEYIYFTCQHCGTEIEVNKNEINCKIFRCGIFINNSLPVPSHLCEQECKRLKDNNLIYGCCCPLRLVDNNTKVVKCGYI